MTVIISVIRMRLAAMSQISKIPILIPWVIAFAMIFYGAPMALSVDGEKYIPSQIAPIIKSSCLDCHDADVQKGNLRLDNLSAVGSDPSAMHTWVRIYDRVAAEEMPPKKKPFSSAQRKEFLDTLRAELIKADTEQQRKQGRVVLRRLSAKEYQHVVRDLFNLPELEIIDFLPIDDAEHGIENIADLQQISYAQMSQYLEAADKVLQAAVALWPQSEANKKRYEARQLTNVDSTLIDNKVTFLKEPNEAQGASRIANATGESGYYRIRFQAQAACVNNKKLQPSSKNLVVGIGVAQGRLRGRFLQTFDLSAQAKVYEFTAWLNAQETVIMHCANIQINGGPKVEVADKSLNGQPVVALDWCEVEGPITKEWPPTSHRVLFGNLPVGKWDKNSDSLPPRDLGVSTGEDRRIRAIRGGPFYVKAKDPTQESKQLLQAFMERAYRRSVKSDEVAVMHKRVMDAMEEKICFHDAMLIAYKAILCSPDFLFVTESPGVLSSEQLATRLALFLWRSLPDDQLLQLAKSGALRKTDVLRSECERMLKDARALRSIDDFTSQWLNLGSIHATVPDKQLYPEYYNDKLLISAMHDETILFVREMVHENLPIKSVVSSDFTFLNQRLAEHYGISGVHGTTIRKVALPKDSVRGGILTQASMMKLTANGFTTSPVKRGTWVLERILGTPPPTPPPDAGAIEPDTRGATTIREILDKHRRVESCASCHSLIDPPGFALESFDVMGAYRERYRSIGKGDAEQITVFPFRYKIKLAQTVDAAGEYNGKKFTDIQSFKKLMSADDQQIARNVLNRLVTQATGATVRFSERSEIERLLQATKSTGYGMQSLIIAVVTSPMFLQK